jgi:hypothetical protein
VAKLIAFREKDINFVSALLDDHLVDLEEVRRRLGTVTDRHGVAREHADSWLGSRKPS